MVEAEEFHKTVPIIRDISLNPSCSHGPTILFDRNGSRFFSCSAFRSRKLCPFYLPEEKWIPLTKQDLSNKSNTESKSSKRKLKSVEPLIADKKLKKSYEEKESCEQSPLLPEPNQRDKGEAQYHFTDETVQFFIDQFQTLQFDSILCIGTPSLHAFIRKNEKALNLKSFLLDIDERLIKKYSLEESSLYNMCNHHFFAEDNEQYKRFLKQSKRLAVVTDPPFGVKVELIWNGCLVGVQNDLKELKNSDDDAEAETSCGLFWIFPYFMEGHILNKCPEAGFQMSDFKIEYKNHSKFSGKPKSKSSPVRVFTTIPLSDIKLPEETYRHCELCQKWVDKNNRHCRLCGSCTTRDGGKTYIHCKKCKKCVKPTWIHCQSPCGKCHLQAQNCQAMTTGRNQKKFKSKNEHKNSNTSKIVNKRRVQLEKQKRKGAKIAKR